MKIKVKFFNDTYAGENELKVSDAKQNWIDLRASEDVWVFPNKLTLIPLGVAMQLPSGYEAHIVPRSSTFKNFGIIQTNHMGIIDETYCGDNDQWFFPAVCLEPKDTLFGREAIYIKKGERICQFRITKRQPEFEYEIVESMNNEDRGGHGSTGTN